MIFSQMEIDEAEGAIIAHTVRLPGNILKKGTVLSADDIANLLQAGIKSVAAARLQADDLGENEAAMAVAEALAGDNLIPGKPMGGRVNLYAKEDGVALIDKNRIDAINLGQCNITVATLPEFAQAVAQQAVATVKIIPFAVARAEVDQCLALAHINNQPPAVSLSTYKTHKVALILTSTAGLKASILDSTREVTSGRLQTLGCSITSEARCAHTINDISQALDTVMM